MTLTKAEVDAILATFMKLTDATVESVAKITAIENVLRKHPEMWAEYQKELGVPKSAESLNTSQEIAASISMLGHVLVRPKNI